MSNELEIPTRSTIKRPPNSWILYRSDAIRRLPPVGPGQPRLAQAEVSRIIAKAWREESKEVKDEYHRRAQAKHQEHKEMYPNYVYHPVRKTDKQMLRAARKEEKRRLQMMDPRERFVNNAFQLAMVEQSSAVPSSSLPGVLPHSAPLMLGSLTLPAALGAWQYPQGQSINSNDGATTSRIPMWSTLSAQDQLAFWRPPVYGQYAPAAPQNSAPQVPFQATDYQPSPRYTFNSNVPFDYQPTTTTMDSGSLRHCEHAGARQAGPSTGFDQVQAPALQPPSFAVPVITGWNGEPFNAEQDNTSHHPLSLQPPQTNTSGSTPTATSLTKGKVCEATSEPLPPTDDDDLSSLLEILQNQSQGFQELQANDPFTYPFDNGIADERWEFGDWTDLE